MCADLVSARVCVAETLRPLTAASERNEGPRDGTVVSQAGGSSLKLYRCSIAALSRCRERVTRVQRCLEVIFKTAPAGRAVIMWSPADVGRTAPVGVARSSRSRQIRHVASAPCSRARCTIESRSLRLLVYEPKIFLRANHSAPQTTARDHIGSRTYFIQQMIWERHVPSARARHQAGARPRHTSCGDR